MSIGQIARKLLGKNFHVVGEWYRKIFVDLDIVLSHIEFSKNVNDKFKLLDIGGGDGAFINRVMEKYPNVQVDLIDIADNIGTFLKEEHLPRARVFGRTNIVSYADSTEENSIQCILIMDVLHHVGKEFREGFFAELQQLVAKNKNVRIIVKDVEPGHFVTWLSYLSDRYISSDKQVWLISRSQVVQYFERFFPSIKHYETKVFENNKPNYSIVFYF